MSDPYQVLGVSSTDTDEEIKKAYRDLARKYHPDNYHDNPLEDLAEEKMKEINEAYDQIQAQRKANFSGSTVYTGHAAHAVYSEESNDSDSPTLKQVRDALAQDRLGLAQELLDGESNQNAEWHFLMGMLCYRRGWVDEAKRYYKLAVEMAPDNFEYRYSLGYLERQQSKDRDGYKPSGYQSMTTNWCDGYDDSGYRFLRGRMCGYCIGISGVLICYNCGPCRL